MIAIINTGGANLASVSNALDRLGHAWTLTCDADAIRSAERVILPGVGAARNSMDRLREAELIEVIRGLQQPTLGICVGMQILFERSEEGDTPCIGVFPGTIHRLQPGPGLRVPHMGWNAVTPRQPDDRFFAGLTDAPYFYFVHAYAAPMGDWVRATVEYGETIPALIQRNNFYGCQFHPERSAQAGARVLENFVHITS